jgi:hypothetical protein
LAWIDGSPIAVPSPASSALPGGTHQKHANMQETRQAAHLATILAAIASEASSVSAFDGSGGGAPISGVDASDLSFSEPVSASIKEARSRSRCGLWQRECVSARLFAGKMEPTADSEQKQSLTLPRLNCSSARRISRRQRFRAGARPANQSKRRAWRLPRDIVRPGRTRSAEEFCPSPARKRWECK